MKKFPLIPLLEKGGKGISSSSLYAIGLIPSPFSPHSLHITQAADLDKAEVGIVRPDSALYSLRRELFFNSCMQVIPWGEPSQAVYVLKNTSESQYRRL